MEVRLLVVRALTSFLFNVFEKRFDMLGQSLVLPVTKESHFLLVGSGVTAIYSPFFIKVFQYISKLIETLLIQNCFYSNAKKYKDDKKPGTYFDLKTDSLIENY